jgi:large conductance mechanosensitive channel
MIKGFKEFVLRGNVVDLAVAVVIGAAFAAVVNQIVTGIFTPLLGALFNAKSLDKALIVKIPTISGENAELLFGAVIGAIIQFILVAAVIYFVVIVPLNNLNKLSFKKKQAGEEVVEDAPPTELELLAEIRDLLAKTPQTPPAA